MSIVKYNGKVVKYGSKWVDTGSPTPVILAGTVRFKFSNDSYDPTSGTWNAGAVWTRVSTSPNVWDYHRDATSWTAEFSDKFPRVFQGGNVEILDSNFSGVTTLTQMFLNCRSLVQVHSMRNTGDAVEFYDTFCSCSNLTHVCKFDIGDLSSGFYGCDGLFRGCSSLLEIPPLDFSRAKRGVYMFSNCSSITELPSTFTTANWTAGYGMFAGCTNLRSIPNTLDTSKMNYLASLFAYCSSLTSVPYVSTASLSRSSYYNNLIHSMFAGCSSLLHAPANFDTTNAKGISNLFSGCTSLKEVPLLNTAYLTDMSNAFNGCVSVEAGALALYTQASTQANPPTSYGDCFKDCGSVGNPSELAQIPTSWGGTMAEGNE